MMGIYRIKDPSESTKIHSVRTVEYLGTLASFAPTMCLAPIPYSPKRNQERSTGLAAALWLAFIRLVSHTVVESKEGRTKVS